MRASQGKIAKCLRVKRCLGVKGGSEGHESALKLPIKGFEAQQALARYGYHLHPPPLPLRHPGSNTAAPGVNCQPLLENK